MDAGGDVVAEGLGVARGAGAREHVVGLPRVVLGLHSKDRALDVLGAVFREHALPHVGGGFVGLDAVLVDAGGCVLHSVGPLETAVVVAGDRAAQGFARQLGRVWVALDCRVLKVKEKA